jgi:hypothetical protein
MRLHSIIVSFLLCILFFMQCDQCECSKNETNISDAIKKVAGTIGSPEVTAMMEVLKSLKTESSTTISNRVEPVGFKYISNIMDHSSGAVYLVNLDKLINIWLEDEVFTVLTTSYKNVLARAIKEYSIQVADEAYSKQKFELSFNDGKGNLMLLAFNIAPHPTKANVFKWSKDVLVSSFQPMPPYVIVSHSDCNILSCDRHDEIVYLDAGLTDSHIYSIINMNMQFLSQMRINENLLTGPTVAEQYLLQ